MFRVPKGLRSAFLSILPMFGRFGDRGDLAPDLKSDKEVTGYMPKKQKPTKAMAMSAAKKAFADWLKRTRLANFDAPKRREKMLAAIKKGRSSQTPGSMRGDTFVVENRRRRAAGLPQMRLNA